jgi:hypothetical protein
MLKLYYLPSGKLPLRVFIWAAFFVLGLMPGPLIVLYPIGYGVLCARAVFLTTKWGKARNPGRMFKVGAAIGLVCWYCQWVAWMSLASTGASVAPLLGHAHSIIDFATDPHLMYTLAMQIRELWLLDDEGVSLVKSPGFAWVLEIAYITLTSGLVAYVRAGQPFCETSDAWGEITELPQRHAFITEEAEFVKQMETDPRETLDILTSAAATESGFSTIKLTLCRPSGKAFVTVDNTAISMDGRNESKKNRTVICDLKIDIALADDLIRQCAMGGALQPPPAAESNPPELQNAIDHLEAGNYEDALTSAAPYLTADEAHLCNDAIRLSALATSRLDRWSAALDFWRRLFDREATAHNALQVATSSVMAGNITQGEQWVGTAAKLNAISADVPWMLIKTNFITALKNSGNSKLALPYLEEVKGIYEDLHSTDASFLALRGVPQFSSFLDHSREIVTSALTQNEVKQWYESMIPHIDATGRTELTGWLNSGMSEVTPTPT